jgi:DNA-binding NarL/FixJ family response regulator
VTRLRTLGRHGGFPICRECSKREHFLIGERQAANAPCNWCGRIGTGSWRALDVATLVAQGRTSRDIGAAIGISAAAVRQRVRRERLGSGSI